MDEVRPAELTRLSSHRAQQDNLLATRRQIVSVERGDGELRLALSTVDAPPDPCTRLHCQAGEAPFVLSVGEARLREFYPEGVANVPLTSLPDPLANALAVVAFRPLMDALEACLGGPISFEGVSEDVPADWRLVGLSSAGNGSTAPVAVMHLSPDADAHLSEFLLAQPSNAFWSAAPSARVPVQVCLRGFDLSAKEFAALEPGGAILLPTDTNPALVSIHLGAGFRFIGFGRPANDVIIVEQITNGAMTEETQELLNGTEEEPEQPQQVDQAEPIEVSLDDVGVRVDFVLGQTTMTFSELQSLTPGFAIKLDTPVSQAVNILASGRVIGEGELVQIDDRLGVRIVRLVERKDG